MGAATVEMVRYYQLRLAQCERAPALHRHQLAALAALRERAVAAADLDAFAARLREDGLAEAEAVANVADRYANQAWMFRRLGDDVRAAAMASVVDAVGGRVAIRLRSLDRVVLAAELAAAAASQGQRAFTRLCRAVHQAIAAPSAGERLAARILIDVTWRELRGVDRGFGWERVAIHAPYRERVPFDDAGLARLRRWCDELRAEPLGFTWPEVQLPPPPPTPEASETEPQLDLDPLPGLIADLVADRGLADAIATARRNAGEVAHLAEVHHQLHVAALADALERDLAAATTAAAAQLAGEAFRERLEREYDALELLCDVALRPLEIALDEAGASIDELAHTALPSATPPGPAPARSVGALAAAEALFGARWRTVVSSGWLRALIDRGVAIGRDPDAPIDAAYLGEVGLSFAARVRQAPPHLATRLAGPVEDLLAWVDGDVRPHVPPARLRIAGHEVAPGELTDALARRRASLFVDVDA